MNKQYFRNTVLVQKPYSVYKNISHCALEYLCYKRCSLYPAPEFTACGPLSVDFPISACCPRGLQGRRQAKCLKQWPLLWGFHQEHLWGLECEMKCKSWVLTLEQWPSTPASGVGVGPGRASWPTRPCLLKRLWRFFQIGRGSDACKGKAESKRETEHFLRTLHGKEGGNCLVPF